MIKESEKKAAVISKAFYTTPVSVTANNNKMLVN